MAETRRIAHLDYDKDRVLELADLIDRETELLYKVKYEYELFTRIWHLPSNRPLRSLIRKYLWPNIREWRKCAKRCRKTTIECYDIALKNALKRLSRE